MKEIANGLVEHVNVLESSNDDHGGVIVEMHEPMSPQAFAFSLRASLLHWKLQVYNPSSFHTLHFNLDIKCSWRSIYTYWKTLYPFV